MFKRFVTNTAVSFISLLLMGVIFTFVAFFLIDNIELIAGPLLMVVFCGLLNIGYHIGQRLYYSKSLSFISVVLFPITILVVLYGLSLVGISFVSMIIQYPSAVWNEAFGLSSDFMNEKNVVRYYAVLIIHYFISAISMLLGARKKDKQM